MNKFYNNIEEPIRELVKRLRDNGINTACSCGHEMYIQANLMLDTQLKVIHDETYNWLCETGKNLNFTIEVHHEVRNGILSQCFVEVRII